jgi:hypothetical protein
MVEHQFVEVERTKLTGTAQAQAENEWYFPLWLSISERRWTTYLGFVYYLALSWMSISGHALPQQGTW